MTAAPRLAEIRAVVAAYFGIAPESILRHDRKSRYVKARLATFWLARRLSPMRTTDIARYMARNHATIRSAVARVETLRAADPQWRAMTDALAGRFPPSNRAAKRDIAHV